MHMFPSPLSPPFLNLQLQPQPPGDFMAEQSGASILPSWTNAGPGCHALGLVLFSLYFLFFF